jgi:hypothetical protein
MKTIRYWWIRSDSFDKVMLAIVLVLIIMFIIWVFSDKSDDEGGDDNGNLYLSTQIMLMQTQMNNNFIL